MGSNTWTQTRITEWAVKTFGRPSNALELVDRALDEVDELAALVYCGCNEEPEIHTPETVAIDDVLEEIADIVIVLSQVVEHLGGDLQDEIAKKMVKNVNRKWVKTGDGVGRHQ